LDDPFSGLDTASRNTLQHAIDELLAAGSPQVLLVMPRLDEIPQGVTHVLRVAGCRIVEKGPRSKILQSEIVEEETTSQSHIVPPSSREFPVAPKEAITTFPTLVEMKDTFVSYGDTTVLDSINWTMKQGENWAILGSNGAGKTTLLSLILADNPQAYANKITLFGKRRGSGESVWDIKQNIGWVSSELQAFHQKGTTCFNAVCSGFFDSIGLYKTCSPDQARTAEQWMDSFGILNLMDHPLGAVSVGEQRLVFLARALVKNPALLILDEPCQGLDISNRTRINDLLDKLCRQTSVNMIYVTHHFEEMPQSITHVLKLDKGRVLASGLRQEILG
jgi:molybdate transport system ATP-binding protein